MARQHGRNGAVYLSVTSGAAASPMMFGAAWSITTTADLRDVTTLADSQKRYITEVPASSGAFSGFLDAGTSQTYVAASDGLPRVFCLYPDMVNSPSVYFAGTVIATFAADGASSSPVSFASTWTGVSAVQRFPLAAGLPGLLDETSAAEVTDEANINAYAAALDEQCLQIERVIQFALDTLGAHHLDVRVISIERGSEA
jgi:hypothetical protein